MIRMPALCFQNWRAIALSVFGIGFSILLVGVLIFFARQELEKKIQGQMIGQHVDLLYALLKKEQRDDPLTETGDPVDQLWAILAASQLPEWDGALATRLFDSEGKFLLGFPAYVMDAQLSHQHQSQLRHLTPVGKLHPRVDLAEHFLLLEPDKQVVPLFEVLLPLFDPQNEQLLGTAQVLLTGEKLAAEFGVLKRELIYQARMSFWASATMLVLILGFAFWKLHRANFLLVQRSEKLAQANEELLLTTKTSAIGPIAAHLLHGLKGSVAGLHYFICEKAAGSGNRTEWEDAVKSIRRMKNLVIETSHFLHQEDESFDHEVVLCEWLQVIHLKINPLAREKNVRFSSEVNSDCVLSNRSANIVFMIVFNLVQNALEATPEGKTVCLRVEETLDGVEFFVKDEGSGFPENIHAFRPCRSNKRGGTGIGLAISDQLAKKLHGKLELRSSSSEGCEFVLMVPWSATESGKPFAACADVALTPGV